MQTKEIDVVEQDFDYTVTIDWDNWVAPVISDDEGRRDEVLLDLDAMRERQHSAYAWRKYLTQIGFEPEFIAQEYKTLREMHKRRDAERCGTPICQYHGRYGRERQTLMCKNYDICPKCQAQRKRDIEKRLKRKNKNKLRYVKAKTAAERKALIEKYGGEGKESYYGQPDENGETDIVIETFDDIGEPVTDQLIEELAEKGKIPQPGRKTSGNLGKETFPDMSAKQDELLEQVFSEEQALEEKSEKQEEKSAFEKQSEEQALEEKQKVNDPRKTISFAPIACNPDNPIVKQIIEEVEKEHYPRDGKFESLEQLQQTIYTLENEIIQRAKDQGHCEKFHILSRKYITVKLSEVLWRIPDHLKE